MYDNKSKIESFTTAEKKETMSTDAVYVAKMNQVKIGKLEEKVKKLEDFKMRLETAIKVIITLILVFAAILAIIYYLRQFF